MIHVLEGVVHRPRPHVWPGHVMADALFVKLEHVPRPFLHDSPTFSEAPCIQATSKDRQ